MRKIPTYARTSTASLVAAALAFTACTNGINGQYRDNGALRWSQGESSVPSKAEVTEARRRIAQAIKAAEELSRQRGLPAREHARLETAITNARNALLRYDMLWAQGQANATIMAGLGTAASAIVADDVTLVGVANDWTVVFIAAAALATHILTESPASSNELVTAWREVGYRLQELSIATENAMAFAAPGNHADTGILDEVYALLDTMGLAITDENICLALGIMWKNADRAGDKKKRKRIETTQKAKKCRHSRHS